MTSHFLTFGSLYLNTADTPAGTLSLTIALGHTAHRNSRIVAWDSHRHWLSKEQSIVHVSLLTLAPPQDHTDAMKGPIW